MDPDAPVLSLDLWRADAVVLHFWLTNVDLDALPFEHAGQKQALRDLLTELDQTAAAEADDEEIVRSHELVDRTGTALDPARARRVTVTPGPAPHHDDVLARSDDDEYGLKPF